jgi:hypothetical protein
VIRGVMRGLQELHGLHALGVEDDIAIDLVLAALNDFLFGSELVAFVAVIIGLMTNYF